MTQQGAGIVQVDSRGQIVIPKEIRDRLGLKDKAEFYLFSISDNGIFLKPVKGRKEKTGAG